jgi:hypothetical protein
MDSFKKYLNKVPPTASQISSKDHIPKECINKKIKIGSKDELEHTSKKEIARYIARMHLGQHLNYYERLRKAGLGD